MARAGGSTASVAWLQAKDDPDDVAGAAFLVGPRTAVTCAHVVRDHLGLGDQTPRERPTAPITIRFEALQQERTCYVAEGGWFGGRVHPELDDIAVLVLDEELAAVRARGLAPEWPRSQEPAFTYGATSGYQSVGQIVYAQIAPQVNARGWWQLDAEPGRGSSYFVERGFSGAPVFDAVGNVVWGMIVAVDAKNRQVAFSIPAEDVWKALGATGGGSRDVPPQPDPGPLDDLARDALTSLREEYERRLDEQRQLFEQQIEDLRRAVGALAEEARQPSAERRIASALQHLKRGETAPAEALMADIVDSAPKATAEERKAAGELARGLGALALMHHTARALEAYETATRLDPDHTWSWIELGRLHLRAGNTTRAGDAFERARQAAERVGDERDRSVAQTSLGDVRVAQGDLAGALAAYQAGIAIQQDLLARDPGHTGWQRDLSVSLKRIGDVRVAQGDLAGALAAYQASHTIAEDLAARDVGNTEWQRDLGVSHNKIGDVRRAQGDLAGALKAYQASHDIFVDLAARDVGNTEWQRDLSVSLKRIGDVRVAQGDLAGALAAYQAGLAIAESLAARDPDHTGWQCDLIVLHWRLAAVAEAGGRAAEAKRRYGSALAIARALAESGRLAPADAWMVAELETRLARSARPAVTGPRTDSQDRMDQPQDASTRLPEG